MVYDITYSRTLKEGMLVLVADSYGNLDPAIITRFTSQNVFYKYYCRSSDSFCDSRSQHVIASWYDRLLRRHVRDSRPYVKMYVLKEQGTEQDILQLMDNVRDSSMITYRNY